MAEMPKLCTVRTLRPPRTYYGKVKKYYEDEGQYAAYLGIQYASVPEGRERYQASKPLTSSEPAAFGEGSPLPYDATVPGKSCPQPPDFSEGSEDCLNLNIFVPADPKFMEEPLPVLVFIHGGGFSTGSNDPELFTPDSIIKYGVILVTINYRLGLHGFLNTHTRHSPGNAGLKDQVKALEWIRDNIGGFNGNPKNVTLSGWSAGATCVNLHLMSPLSKDLFHKAIIQSGGVFCPWGYKGHQNKQKKVLLRNSKIRASLFAEKDSETLHKDASEALGDDRKKRHEYSFSPLLGPSIETVREEAFLTEDVREMMKKVDHDKPIMAGITKEEGIDHFLDEAAEPKEVMIRRLINSDDAFYNFLKDRFRWTSETPKSVANEIRKHYFDFPNPLTDFAVKHCWANFARDISFHRFYDNFKFGPEETVHKNLYVYRFDHVSDISVVRDPTYPNLDGDFNDATHGDDLVYLYLCISLRAIYEKSQKKKEIKEVMKHLGSLWANFCKTGVPRSDSDPHVEWRRHTEENPCFMSISDKLRLIEDSLFREEWAWLNALIRDQPTEVSELPTPSSELTTPNSELAPQE